MRLAGYFAIATLAAGLAFINVDLWDLAFILVPLLFVLRKKIVNVQYFNFKLPGSDN